MDHADAGGSRIRRRTETAISVVRWLKDRNQSIRPRLGRYARRTNINLTAPRATDWDARLPKEKARLATRALMPRMTSPLWVEGRAPGPLFRVQRCARSRRAQWHVKDLATTCEAQTDDAWSAQEPFLLLISAAAATSPPLRLDPLGMLDRPAGSFARARDPLKNTEDPKMGD